VKFEESKCQFQFGVHFQYPVSKAKECVKIHGVSRAFEGVVVVDWWVAESILLLVVGGHIQSFVNFLWNWFDLSP